MDIVSLPHSSPECQGTSCVYFLQGTQQKTRWYGIQNNVPQARLCVLWGFKARCSACNFADLHIKDFKELDHQLRAIFINYFYHMKHRIFFFFKVSQF